MITTFKVIIDRTTDTKTYIIEQDSNLSTMFKAVIDTAKGEISSITLDTYYKGNLISETKCGVTEQLSEDLIRLAKETNIFAHNDMQNALAVIMRNMLVDQYSAVQSRNSKTIKDQQ